MIAARILAELGSSDVVEAMERVVGLGGVRGGAIGPLGRSSRHLLRRHSIRHAGLYQAALDSPEKPADAEGVAHRGRIQRLLGRRGPALENLDKALALRPTLAAPYAWRWELRLGDGARDISYDDIDRAVRLDPDNAHWRLWRALGRLARKAAGDWRPALRDIETALSLDQGRGLAHAAAALAYDELDKPRESLRAWDAAISREPRQAWLFEQRAILRLRQGDNEGFETDCSSAILLDERIGYFNHALGDFPGHRPDLIIASADRYLKRRPGAYWAILYRGDCRRAPEINDFSGALSDMETAAGLRPDCPWAWAYLSRARASASSTASALEAIHRAIALAPDCGWFRVWRGEIRRRSSAAHGCLADFDRGLSLDPDYEFGYALRGAARRARGLTEQALADLELACRFDPGHALSQLERSSALRELGRIPEALDALELARGRDPKYRWCPPSGSAAAAIAELDGELRLRPRNARALAWRGETKIGAADYRGAKEDLDGALALDPDYPQALAWRGWALFWLGLKSRALRDLNRAIQLDGRLAHARAWRGRVLQNGGNLKSALQDFSRASRLDRKSAWILQWKGETELSLSRPRAALRTLNESLSLHPRNPQALTLRAEAQRALSLRGTLR